MSDTLRVAALLAIVVTLSACSQNSPLTSVESPPLRGRVEVTDSNFEPSVSFLGVERSIQNEEFLNVVNDSYYIVSLVDRATGVEAHRVTLIEYYEDDWRFYNRATDDQSRVLEFTSLAREVVDCWSGRPHCAHYEVIGAVLPPGYLQERRTGFSVQFASRRGDRIVVDVTGEMIAAQLSAIERWRADNL